MRPTLFCLILDLSSVFCVQGRPPDWQDFVGIITLLVMNSTVSFIEENNAGNAAAALMARLAPKAKVHYVHKTALHSFKWCLCQCNLTLDNFNFQTNVRQFSTETESLMKLRNYHECGQLAASSWYYHSICRKMNKLTHSYIKSFTKEAG